MLSKREGMDRILSLHMLSSCRIQVWVRVMIVHTSLNSNSLGMSRLGMITSHSFHHNSPYSSSLTNSSSSSRHSQWFSRLHWPIQCQWKKLWHYPSNSQNRHNSQSSRRSSNSNRSYLNLRHHPNHPHRYSNLKPSNHRCHSSHNNLRPHRYQDL